ncbi:hypothetical protein DM02DRAFT_686797 [Periconia macrospinosa]|uniref:Uncharacterized protein n=1 Tax=Periconia macrospinosa TaxID=97972 RepID=A0A2V1DHV8_9PLEO|nr:hypothetical protein DM02DRAFT_686797 [Periconia macrospinosa]
MADGYTPPEDAINKPIEQRHEIDISLTLIFAPSPSDRRISRFLAQQLLSTADPSKIPLWGEPVLNKVAKRVFTIAGQEPLRYFERLLDSPHLPDFPRAVTAINLPEFHKFFPGIQPGPGFPTFNPELVVARRCVNLTHLKLALNTVSLTESPWPQYMISVFENEQDFHKARELRPISLARVVRQYGMNAILKCAKLRVLEITCVDDPHVRQYCNGGDRLGAFNGLKDYFENEFFRRNNVYLEVKLEVLSREGT